MGVEKMNTRKLTARAIVLVTVLAVIPLAKSFGAAPQVSASLIRHVRHELAMLPYYGVFDWLEFEAQPDGSVTLRGQVTRPTTKSDAEARVKEVEGVKNVVNQIQVLPVSPQDDRLRIALYRTLYNWDSPLFRYATQSIPPIHIIVDHGRATLKGIVESKADAQLAYMRARSVPGLFDVKNELVVSSDMAQ